MPMPTYAEIKADNQWMIDLANKVLTKQGEWHIALVASNSLEGELIHILRQHGLTWANKVAKIDWKA